MPQNLILAAGNYEINTSTGDLTGPGISVRGQVAGGKVTFSFAQINIENGANIQVRGTTPVISRAVTLRSTAKLFRTATAFPALRLHAPAQAEETALVRAEATGRKAWAPAEQDMAAREERAAPSAARLQGPAARTITTLKIACRTAAAEERLEPVQGPERAEEMVEGRLRYSPPTPFS
jgi:hypothetical protein